MGEARQKLWQAVDCLVRAKPIRDRLIAAAEFIVQLPVDRLPEEHRAEAERICSLLTRYNDDQDGAIAETVRRLSEDVADQIARDILGLYTSIRGGI